MTNLPAPIVEALANRSIASKFNHGRFDRDMKWSAERQFAEQSLIKNPELLKCTTGSIQQALLDVSYSGLSLAPSLAHGYLIPYKSYCSFHPGYRGLLHLAYRAGTVKSVQSNVVYDKDQEFMVWTDEKGRHIRHIENQRGKRGDISHSYCIANLTAGGPPLIEVLNRDQLRDIEAAASKRNPKGGMVWRGPFRDEMCRKAVIRRASKTWPKDDGGILQHMMQVSDQHDGVNFDVATDEDPPEQEICCSLDEVTQLNDVLVDNGITPDVASDWLRRYALAKGYSSIENMPVRLFDEAKRALTQHAIEARQSGAQ